jgi:hypothetical protein
MPGLFSSKEALHLLQIYIGGHGKTGRVDGPFGFIVACEKAVIKSGFDLKTVTEFKEFCEDRKARQHANLDRKTQELHPWFFLEWKPPDAAYPQQMTAFKQNGIHSNWSWTSKWTPTASGLGTREIRQYGIVPDHTGLRMQSIPSGARLQNAHEYQLCTISSVDKNKNQRTIWQRRKHMVPAAPPTNLTTLEQRRVTVLKIKTQQTLRTKATLKKCTGEVIPEWGKDELRLNLVQDKPQLKLTVKSLTTELQRHGLNYSGTLLQNTQRLLTHLSQVTHRTDTVRIARSKPLLHHFRPSGGGSDGGSGGHG